MLPRIELTRAELSSFAETAAREWLVTNGLGGYASGTIAGARTRRYHGLLVAALKPPVERTVLVAKIEALARFVDDPPTRRVALTSNEFADGTVDPNGFAHIQRFQLEGTLPMWEHVVGDAVVTQRIWMAHGAHTTYVSYTHLRGDRPIELELSPLCTYRDYHSHSTGGWTPVISPNPQGCEVTAFVDARTYRVSSDAGRFEHDFAWYWGFHHRAEAARGLDTREDLFRPGRFVVTLAPGESVTLTLSAETESPSAVQALAAERSRQHRLVNGSVRGRTPEWVDQLRLAADQFIVTRTVAMSRGHTVIAGYPWFSDWGRDTMIALPGLTLATRRFDIAASILRTFAAHLSRGMLPNRFPDAGEAPEYNTVDATLWYFHALDQYVTQSGDGSLVRELFPALIEVIDWHIKGTRYGIRMTEDGLITAGEPGVQLTWMDARVGDWVVTPRIGKPVEINALWYHALVVMVSFAKRLKDRRNAERFLRMSSLTAASFRKRFWNAAAGHLYDVIDGTEGKMDSSGRRSDASHRPNQIIAVSVTPELLEPDQARAVVDACARELWTPVGLRSLAPTDRSYVPRYRGGPRERDGAYHQGTVWSWLLGPFALAHHHVYRDAAAALRFLDGVAGHLREACIGSVSEIFDGEAPHQREGCYAQAWSVAEVLRAYLEISAKAQHVPGTHGTELGTTTPSEAI
jgi:predicted glycogen debranching enzyme